MSNRNNTNAEQMSNEQALEFLRGIAPPGSNIADIDYMSALWEGIHEFSNTMLKATKKYKKEITSKSISSRKRKVSSSTSSKDKDSISSPPPHKKQKISHSTSKPKPSPKKKKTPKKSLSKSSSSSSSKKKKKTPSPKKKKKSKSSLKTETNDDGRIYRIRRPRTSWVLFNAQRTASLLKNHPNTTLGQRTKISSKSWHALNEQDRGDWDEKAEREKLEYQNQSKQFEIHRDFELVPNLWKQIDKKAEKERKDKEKEKKKADKMKEKKKEISPKKKQIKKKKISPKKKGKKMEDKKIKKKKPTKKLKVKNKKKMVQKKKGSKKKKKKRRGRK